MGLCFQSQLKKLFFGALRIRKEQEAADPTLATKRRASSVGVWDAIKNRMDEALERTRKYVFKIMSPAVLVLTS